MANRAITTSLRPKCGGSLTVRVELSGKRSTQATKASYAIAHSLCKWLNKEYRDRSNTRQVKQQFFVRQKGLKVRITITLPRNVLDKVATEPKIRSKVIEAITSLPT